MIIDLFLWIVFSLVRIFLSLFALITWVIPDWVEEGLIGFFAHLGYLNGVLPITADAGLTGLASTIGLVDVFNLGLTFLVGYFTVLIIVKLIQFVPWVGNKTEL